VTAFAILGLVVFLGVHQALGSIEIAIDARTLDGELLIPRLREIILVMALLSTALIVATGMFSTAFARMGERQRLEARLDTLTGCLNRRTFEVEFDRESERSRRLGMGLGLLFVDLDHFKAINDRFGHAFGDRVLWLVARRIEQALRETDLLFRWGGEEFVVLMPHSLGNEIGTVAERVRTAVAETPLPVLPGEAPVAVTTSVGAADAADSPADAEQLLARADLACYQAKQRGRNQAVFAPATV